MYILGILISYNVEIYLNALQTLNCTACWAGIKMLTYPMRKSVKKSLKNHNGVYENSNCNNPTYKKSICISTVGILELILPLSFETNFSTSIRGSLKMTKFWKATLQMSFQGNVFLPSNMSIIKLPIIYFSDPVWKIQVKLKLYGSKNKNSF